MPERPNLLFLMTDHQRADSTGMVQAGPEVTPHLNRLASKSTVLTRAYTTCPLCVPARTALATGTYPTRNGVVVNDWRGQTAGDYKPIHQLSAEAGDEVGHVGVHHIRVRPGLRQRVTFAKWTDNSDYAQHLQYHGIDPTPAEGADAFRREVTENQEGRQERQKYSNTTTATWPHPLEHFRDNYFRDEAIAFLKQEHAAAWALFVCLWAPHPPLRVPRPYDALFDPARLELPANVGVPATAEPANRRQGITAQLAEGVPLDQWRRLWPAHLGLVAMADAALGEILGTLETTGQ